MICPRCSGTFQGLKRHAAWCAKLPLSHELAQMLDDDPALTVRKMTCHYNVGYQTLRKRLEGTRWTKRRLDERGKKARRMGGIKGNSKKGLICKCGILVETKGDACQWCRLEADGVRSYHELLDVGYVRYMPEVV